MKGLLIKDFELLLQQKKILSAVLLLSVMLNYNSDGTFVIGYLTFVCAFLVLNSITYDEYENGYPFLFTLPIRRNTYVRSKYVFTVMICVFAWLAGCLVAVAFFLARNQIDRMPEAMEEAGIFLPGVLIFLAVMLPLQFKFGTEKSRIVIIIVFGICFLAGYLAKTMADTTGIQLDQVVNQFNHLWKQNTLLAEAGILIGTVVVLGISYLASVTVIKQKEF